MKKSQGWFCLLAAAGLVAIMAGVVMAQSYKKYCNPRFGFCVAYPVHFGLEPAPVNNDGRAFYDGQGLRMSASGSNNVMDETLESERGSQERQFDSISYRTGGTNWYVLSGYKGNEIIYLKTYVGQGSSNHLYISYPARLQAEYQDVVTRISRSFTPGRLGEAH
jgi:hypothetical protein